MRYSHSGCPQFIQGIHLGVLPGRFLFFATKTRAFFHGARFAAIFFTATFSVVDRLMKAALIDFLVNLRATDLVAALDDIHGGFLAAHQLANNSVNNAILDQRHYSVWGLHSL